MNKWILCTIRSEILTHGSSQVEGMSQPLGPPILTILLLCTLKVVVIMVQSWVLGWYKYDLHLSPKKSQFCLQFSLVRILLRIWRILASLGICSRSNVLPSQDFELPENIYLVLWSKIMKRQNNTFSKKWEEQSTLQSEIVETTFSFPKFRTVPWRFRYPSVNHFVSKRFLKKRKRNRERKVVSSIFAYSPMPRSKWPDSLAYFKHI